MNALSTFLVPLEAVLRFAQSQYSYHVIHILGSGGSWDYVVPDPPNHQVFLARQNDLMATRVH
jgi:hypothetical protein